ncbi:MAG: DUF2849 domain-containing protein [Rhodospirillaceae bacterium]|jgi:hypothetical protein|nr:DUF2849 domain-containing protein [Rhodospirillaceae bacterium]MBT5666755.1 DUF2849 domain-containing protein [Rhodospirillaceae bacterium]MBT5809495.1 DUF2849 domain-containing protein [Rhodospirillaceae bacterium]
MSFQIVTANRLTDGFVVYMAGGNEWSTDIEDSARARSPAAGEQLLVTGRRAMDTQEIIDPYLIDADDRNGRISPVKYRERIRATGPSTGDANRRPSRREAA